MNKELLQLIANPTSLWKDHDLSIFDYRFGLKYLGEGRNRTVYLLPSQKHVVKIPHCQSGVWANIDEVMFSRLRPDIISRSRPYGMSIIQVRLSKITRKFSEYRLNEEERLLVELARSDERLRKAFWINNINKSYKIAFEDGLQAGRKNNGQLVYFDFNGY
jgi:hypothetical protein